MKQARQGPAGHGTIAPVYDPTTNFLNVHEWSYGVTECIHIASFALSIGTIAAVDLRLMGVTIGKTTAARLARELAPWTLAGLVIVILTGLLIFATDPLRYYYHPTIRLKIECLVVAIVYNYTVHRLATRSSASLMFGRLVAVGSIALWVTVVFCGLFYAFT